MQPHNSLSLLPVATVFLLWALLRTSLAATPDLEREQRLAAGLQQRLTGMHPLSRQVEVPGANHYFDAAGDEPGAAICEWLDKLPPRASRH